tara:strand:+ start:181 stop:507 length:327 start_codon:yes stop_codon:yes gene_type:complete
MPIFVKTEKFKDKTSKLSSLERRNFLSKHKEWIDNIIQSGVHVYSGYLTNENRIPGGGGLLIIEAKDYLTAKKILKDDPMIKNDLVNWELKEWIPINGSKPIFFDHLG